MGFPDGYTEIPRGKKGKPASHGPRYRALGNSIAINALRWVGKRISLVDSL
jgi:DNA (cytosine-5)-methyltransferase 1